MKRFASIVAGLLGLVLQSSAFAGSLIDLRIVNRASGDQLAVYSARGASWISGTPGDKYSIIVQNKTARRVLAVVSVDGINVVSGQSAAARQSGYVLEPYGRVEIDGWRKSLDEVAAFYFTRLPDSYAARTQRPDNVGVIGVAVFREKYQPPASISEGDSPAKGRAAKPATAPQAGDSAESANADERIGTGHGEREASPARYAEFKRASSAPNETLSIYYDTYDNLVARRIIPEPRRPHPKSEPDPFPENFVPDPC